MSTNRGSAILAFLIALGFCLYAVWIVSSQGNPLALIPTVFGTFLFFWISIMYAVGRFK